MATVIEISIMFKDAHSIGRTCENSKTHKDRSCVCIAVRNRNLNSAREKMKMRKLLTQEHWSHIWIEWKAVASSINGFHFPRSSIAFFPALRSWERMFSLFRVGCGGRSCSKNCSTACCNRLKRLVSNWSSGNSSSSYGRHTNTVQTCWSRNACFIASASSVP